MEKRLERVEDVLMEVAMSHCPDTIIGGAGTGYRGISGGEKKRLAFGTELLNDPSIIFADEPTSGACFFPAPAPQTRTHRSSPPSLCLTICRSAPSPPHPHTHVTNVTKRNPQGWTRS